MADGETPIALAGEFAPVERDTWESLAGDIEALRSTTYDGIGIEPLYTSEDALGGGVGLPGFAPFVRGRTAASTRTHGWDVRQVVDARLGRGAAVTELERGATSVLLRLRDEAAYDIDELLLARLLEGVLFDVAPVVLDAGLRCLGAAEALERAWERLGADPTTVSGSFGIDLFGEWASDRSGTDLDAHLEEFDASAPSTERYPNMRLVTVDGTRFHDAGASDAQELGLSIAVAVATLRVLTDGTRNLDIAHAFGQLELRLAATADQFATIAKFRAARRLWARVAEIAGAPDAASSTPLHAMSSRAMMTRYDPAVNMLRTTVACFAAGVAGADAVTVLPYDELLSDAGSARGRRLARNTQSVLAMESHIARVIDPAGGSWYVERRTDDVAEAAWACFQEIESAGGFRAAVEAGIVNERIADVRHVRQRDIDHRRFALTGVSEFPNIAETSPVPAAARQHSDDGSLPRHRWAERFEEIRERVDIIATSGQRPSVMLATLGSPEAYTARAMFAKNFFEVAGIETRPGPVTSDVPEIVAAFDTRPSRVVCICSSDAVYADHGAPLAHALAAAGATRVYLAGNPRDHLDALTEAGVTHTIIAGFDVRAALADLVGHLETS